MKYVVTYINDNGEYGVHYTIPIEYSSSAEDFLHELERLVIERETEEENIQKQIEELKKTGKYNRKTCNLKYPDSDVVLANKEWYSLHFISRWTGKLEFIPPKVQTLEE